MKQSEFVLTYTQASGFGMHTQEMDMQTDEHFDAWVQRIGFELVGDEYGVQESSEISVRYRSVDAKHSWAALVTLADLESWNAILVPTRADLFSLRVKLSTVLLSDMAGVLISMQEWALKAFRTWHGHDADDVCGACDPREARRLADIKKKRGGDS